MRIAQAGAFGFMQSNRHSHTYSHTPFVYFYRCNVQAPFELFTIIYLTRLLLSFIVLSFIGGHLPSCQMACLASGIKLMKYGVLDEALLDFLPPLFLSLLCSFCIQYSCLTAQ